MDEHGKRVMGLFTNSCILLDDLCSLIANAEPTVFIASFAEDNAGANIYIIPGYNFV